MGRRQNRKITRATKILTDKDLDKRRSGRRLIAAGRISPEGRVTYVTFESMSEIGKAAVRRVFRETSRAEEIANM